MKLPRLLSALPCLAIGYLGVALAACADVPPEEEVRDEGQRFSTTPSEPNHEKATAEGLPFLRPDVLLALQVANVSTDVEFFLSSAHHFDDCNFSGGSQVVASNEADAVAHLDPADLSPEADAAALLAFGRALHAVQDFYAHSNWVELGAVGLVDGSLTPWPTLAGYAQLQPSGVVIVEGDPPAGTKLNRRADDPYPGVAVVTVRTSGEKKLPGLISGTVDYEPGNFCPAEVQMTHEELNKDHSDEPGREAQHVKAMALAVEQSHHEWCRLLSLTQSAWGDAGVQRLLGWASDPAAAQCPQP